MSYNISLPSSINGFGTLAVTNASAALSGVVTGPNSNTWKMPFVGAVTILNASTSAGTIFVAPLGGTATTSCLPIAPGASWSFNLDGSSISPSVISDSTATAVVVW